jgi:site-specific DNA recombinase
MEYLLMRAALYARLASIPPDLHSLSDQIALTKSYAERNDFTVVDTYEDLGKSGASTLNRAEFQRMVSDAKAQRFDVIVTESLDQLSRNQADMAILFEHLSFHGVCIHTLADGLITELHIGIKGTMAVLFLKDLAQKTRLAQIRWCF